MRATRKIYKGEKRKLQTKRQKRKKSSKRGKKTLKKNHRRGGDKFRYVHTYWDSDSNLEAAPVDTDTAVHFGSWKQVLEKLERVSDVSYDIDNIYLYPILY